jgi:hypothetical protein
VTAAADARTNPTKVNPRQPVYAYTNYADSAANTALLLAGFSGDTEELTEVRAFGADKDPIRQRRWYANSAQAALDTIMQKYWADEEIAVARQQIGLASLKHIL